MKAIWNDTVVAESDEIIELEGNAYFPPESLQMEYFEKTAHTTHCPWKGDASYYALVVDGNRNENAAWVYKKPKDAAKEITGYVAFWKGVRVES